MTRLLQSVGVALAFLLTAVPAFAADNYRIIEATGATRTMAASDIGSVLYPRQLIQGLSAGVPTAVQMTTPGALNVNCVVGCDGGGGGGVVTNAGTFAVQVTAALPAGANSIGAVTLGGTLPAFASTPTFNIGTMPALAAGENTIGTVNLGTIAGASTAANQATGNATLAALDTDIGAPADAACASGAVSCALIPGIKALITAAQDTTAVAVNMTQIGGAAVPVGNGAAATAQRVVIANDNTAFSTNPQPTATMGCTPGGLQSAATTNATSIKASAGTLCGGMAINTTASIYYARLYNLAAAPTCSSETGFVATIPIPASTTGSGTLIDFGTFGASFSTGIALCLTGGPSSTDDTNAATGVFLTYAFK